MLYSALIHTSIHTHGGGADICEAGSAWSIQKISEQPRLLKKQTKKGPLIISLNNAIMQYNDSTVLDSRSDLDKV